MSVVTRLMVRFMRSAVQLTDCIAFRFEKERYTPYTMLSGEWYCPSNLSIGETLTFQFAIDNKVVHLGYPTSAELIKRDGRTVLKLTSVGYSAALTTNQCADGLIPDVDLMGLIKSSGFVLPNITYQQNTPVANYVN